MKNLNTYPIPNRLTVGDLKKILANMADNAIVTARDRDGIALDMVHVVGIPVIENTPKVVRFVDNIGEVYGGHYCHLDNPSKQAIILFINYLQQFVKFPKIILASNRKML